MRMEVAQFIGSRLEAGQLSGHFDAHSAASFKFNTLADELVLGSVYIKHFLSDPSMQIDDPFQLCHDLLAVSV